MIDVLKSHWSGNRGRSQSAVEEVAGIQWIFQKFRMSESKRWSECMGSHSRSDDGNIIMMNRFPSTIGIRLLPIRRPLCSTRLLPRLSPILITLSLKPRTFRHGFSTRPALRSADSPNSSSSKPSVLKENIYTLPNLLTVSRIIACPILGWSIVEGQFHLATSLLLYAGLTDLVCPFML